MNLNFGKPINKKDIKVNINYNKKYLEYKKRNNKLNSRNIKNSRFNKNISINEGNDNISVEILKINLFDKKCPTYYNQIEDKKQN